MKRTTKTIGLLSRTALGFFPLLIVAIFIPILVLAVLGLVDVIQNGQWLLLSVLLASSSLVMAAGYLWVRRQQAQATGSGDDVGSASAEARYDVAPSKEWGEFEQQLWQQLNEVLKEQLSTDDSWPALRDHSVVLAQKVGVAFYPDRTASLAFTAPEFLLMLEQVSRRYRRFILAHVPYAEKLKLSTLQQGYQHKDKLGKAKKVYDAYRVFRALTPAGLIAEARGQLLGKLFDEVSDELQYQLKKVLLQEVVSVAIDLYSGRFTVSDDELGKSNGLVTDEASLAADVEPLRVAVIGQVSAGKSSFVNAFVGSMVAEVSPIPSTDSIVIHKCEVEGLDLIHLVDLPGLDSNPATLQLLLEQMANSDLVFWLVKANQPARQLDTALRAKFDAYYQLPENSHRKKPVLIMLLNQVDRLSPVGEWSPPYNIENPSNAKAATIKAALDYNIEQLHPDEGIVIAMPEGKEAYNMSAVGDILLMAFEDGVNTQLNRRRLDRSDKAVADHAKRLYRLGKVAVSHWLK
ncbi:GTPase [Photobacterium aquae]|uniref:GTPase n=1 Tax=Photobacterium aquae TaxID=1195763 RepID=A0A0J1JXY4_9GAMM|nr:dynamin family protein [Photobacterium aquae]KLV07147.1 GTPase [Photobacterium aquae]